MQVFPSSVRWRTSVLPLASLAVLIAMWTVQVSHVAADIEVAVRWCSAALGIVGAPVLLVLASRQWLTKDRVQLSRWRNGFALASIVALTLAWMFYWPLYLTFWFWPYSLRYFGALDVLTGSLYSGLLGLILASALRGTARAQAVSASLLLWASIAAGMYF